VVVLILFVMAYYVIYTNNAASDVFLADRSLPIYSVEREDNIISLTFDCAWGSDDIPEIMEILKDKNVKATFFIVGQWAEKYPEKVIMISKNGHDVANHSYSHLRMGTLEKAKINDEIDKCTGALEKLTGKRTDLFRAPYGDYTNNVIRGAESLGLKTIQWDVDSLDWKPELNRGDIISRVYEKVHPGSIVLFHNDTKYTAGLLSELIDGLRSRGYEFLPVSELIIREDYNINFEGRQIPNSKPK
jgi:polysaccharide deacetylase family sporulation protein PdaB